MKFRHHMLRITFAALSLALTCGPAAAKQPKATDLLAGGSLALWKPPKDAACWQVEDGVLYVRSNKQRQGDILQTKKAYSDYELSLAFKMISGTVDSGVHLRDTRDQIQIGMSGSLKRDMTGSPYIPGKGYPVEAENVADLLKPNDWNHLKITAIGPEYRVWLNGQHAMRYVSETAIEKGPIGLQLHGARDMQIAFKTMTVRELPSNGAQPTQPKSQAQIEAERMAKAFANSNRAAKDLDLTTMPNVADGFQINLFAQEPHIINPSALVFDKKGRLYVGAGPQYRTPQPDSPKDYIKIFIDEDEDGVAETVKTFAQGLNSVQGMIWKGDELWVANAPDITKLRDTDGDDVADEYTLVFTGLNTLRHGVHGFNWGPDGYLYFSLGNTRCGDHAPKIIRDLQGYTSDHPDNNEPVNIVTDAANYQKSYRTMRKHETEGGILRFRHDGSGLEVYARGMRNPWDICMDSGFNWLATDNDPGPPGDRVFHPIEHGHYSFRHAWNFDWRGQHDSVAPASLIFQGTSGSGTGVLWYTADHFPEPYQNQFFIADWTNNCVFMYETRWDGALQASKQATMTKVVDGGVNTSGDLNYKAGKGIPLFRPTDIAVGPDGAMYIAGWGSTYGTAYVPETEWTAEENAKYQGRVFRLRHDNPLIQRSEWNTAKRVKDHSQWSFEELMEDLGHQQEVWRVDAQEELIRRSDAVAGELIAAIESGDVTEMQETWGLWALARMEGINLAERFVSYAMGATPLSLNGRVQATRIMGENRIADINSLVKLLSDAEPRIRLAAYQSLGKTGFGEQSQRIVAHVAEEKDRACFYTGWQVMRRQIPAATRKSYLGSEDASLRYAAALSLMEDGAMDLDTALGLASDADPRNAELAAFWMSKKGVGRQPIAAHVSDKNFRDKTTVKLEAKGMLHVYYTLDGSEPTASSTRYTQPLTLTQSASLKAAGFTPKGIQLTDTRTVSVHKITDAEWRDRLFVTHLRVKSKYAHEVLDDNLQRGVATSIGANTTYTQIPDELAGATMIRGHARNNRLSDADLIRFKINVAADIYVAFDASSPTPAWLSAFSKTPWQLKTSNTHRPLDVYKKQFAAGDVVLGGNIDKRSQAKPEMYQVFLLKAGTADAGKATLAAVQSLADQVDLARGKELFFGRGTCFACHQVEGQGIVLGPDLNGIGKRRDLNYVITSIIDPSVYIVEGYQQTSLELKNGAKLFGMVQEETRDALKIALPTGAFKTVKTTDIKQRDDATLSGMPDFSRMLQAQDVADISAWLMSTQPLATEPAKP